ncbi:hypothetical protein EDD85DRAFT_922576 [Armillaria nabsnona]|nr:hypothetical protein EDD85DRAFT_922576 [Armillaria nabsnona]
MEVFHNAHLQCLWLSLQAFLRILCDLNSIAYEPYMHQQFTICYDLYVAILKRVEHHINQNACAACTLSLRDEPGTPIHPHYCMDGNNSLKRLQRYDLMCGYDVGCKFGMTIVKSPLGVLATEQNHTTVVGAFHGHAHCWICQICKLPLYTDGQGLTDHEECLVDRYNAAAKALEPPRPMLKWEDVIAYTFLSEFDLLKDTREDICEKPWANSAIQEASDAYYRIIYAQEEVHRLNIEIRRFVTKIKAKEKYLR